MKKYTFKLRFSPEEISAWSKQYDYRGGDDKKIAEIGNKAKVQGFLTRDQFLAIVGWKSARPAKHHASNDDETIKEVTKLAFATKSRSLHLRALMLLEGVDVRTASAILHFCHNERYPILDVRAIWSLGIETSPKYWMGLWDEYEAECRKIATNANVTMRDLDRALWAYSAKHQPK